MSSFLTISSMSKSINRQLCISSRNVSIIATLLIAICIVIAILIWVCAGILKVIANKKEEVDLIILITSADSHHNKRSVIRKTWLGPKSRLNTTISLRHFFVVGSMRNGRSTKRKLEEETNEFNDILLLEVDDGMNHLTNKVIESFWWVNKGFDIKYLLKCDDDSYVRIDKLSSALKQIENMFLNENPSNVSENEELHNYISHNIQKNRYETQPLGLYWGYFTGIVAPFAYGSYAESNWIACDKHMPYAFGGGYVLSKSVVKYLSENKNNLRLYIAEDVSVGIWLSSMANIIRIHDVRFDTEYESCSCQNYYIVMHSLDPEKIVSVYETLQLTGQPCVAEHKKQKFQEYHYKWNVPPSKCCAEESNIL